MVNIIYSIIWILILWFFMWPIAGILASFWILFMPFEACFSFFKELDATLLKWIKFCETVGQNIKEGKSFS